MEDIYNISTLLTQHSFLHDFYSPLPRYHVSLLLSSKSWKKKNRPYLFSLSYSICGIKSSRLNQRKECHLQPWHSYPWRINKSLVTKFIYTHYQQPSLSLSATRPIFLSTSSFLLQQLQLKSGPLQTYQRIDLFIH